MTHKYAPILNAILDGKTIQLLHGDGSYIDIDRYDAFYHLSDRSSETLRVKPDTLNIAGIDVVKPMTEKPRIDQMFYYITAYGAYGTDGVGEDYWSDSKEDNQKLHSGMCWITRDAAVNAAAAIKKLLKGE